MNTKRTTLSGITYYQMERLRYLSYQLLKKASISALLRMIADEGYIDSKNDKTFLIVELRDDDN